ncbi:MAG TPA: hypothetical protein VMV02_07315 [Acidimicrobiales bacterium]|nr:hypothetical protein [Acidimicrobiales bacterium]
MPAGTVMDDGEYRGHPGLPVIVPAGPLVSSSWSTIATTSAAPLDSCPLVVADVADAFGAAGCDAGALVEAVGALGCAGAELPEADVALQIEPTPAVAPKTTPTASTVPPKSARNPADR